VLNTVLAITIVASIAAYLGYSRINVRQRRKYAWDLLMAHLEPRNHAAEQRFQLCLDKGQDITRDEQWKGAQSANDLWSMYVNAGIMLETANYLARNYTGVDHELVETLRSDATQVRARALVALSSHACSQVNDYTAEGASRAAAYSADVLTRTTKLLDGNATQLAFSFASQM
jgi:hypothetical protein